MFCRTFKKYERAVIQMYTDACMNTENEINFLEHVQSKVSVKVKYRGKILIRIKFFENICY
jgi:hypothetical protein